MPRVNLSQNPALGANATDWSSGTRVSPSGFQRPNAYQGSGSTFYHEVHGITPGSSLLVSFDHRLGSSGSPRLTITWNTAGGAFLDFVDVNLGSLSGGVVRRLEAIVTPPANTEYAELQFKSFPSGSQVTAVLLEHRADAIGYADGETSGWQWDGTRYNSTSSELDSVQHQGAAAFAGAGAMASAGVRARPGAGVLAATGGLTAAVRQGHTTAAAFVGAGSVAGVAVATRHAAAVFAGDGAMAVAAGRVQPAAVALAGAGDLAVAAGRGQAAAAEFTGSGSLGALAGEAGAAAFAGTGGLGVAATEQDHAAVAEFAGEGQVGVAVQADHRVAALFAGDGDLDAAGARAHPATVDIAGAGALVADGTRVHPGVVELVGDGQLGSDPTRVGMSGSTFAGSGQMQARAVGAAGQALNIFLWAVDPATGALIPLPHYTKLSLSPIANSPGSISVDYPAFGRNADVLRDGVTARRDLEIEVWLGGRASTAMRGLLSQATGDDVHEQAVWSFAGHFLEQRMAETLVWPQDGDPKKELRFNAVNAGEIVGFLLDQAQARGALTDIGRDFDDTTDSSGTPWPDVVTGLKFSPKTTYLQVLSKLVELGVLEWAITAQHMLRVWVFGTRGVDRTAELRPVSFRRGRNVAESPRRRSSRDAGTAVLVDGAEGLYEALADATALAERGRRVEVAGSAGNIENADALSAFAQRFLQSAVLGEHEQTHALTFGVGHPIPVRSFDIGDNCWSETTGTLEAARVSQWELTVEVGGPAGTVSLGDLHVDRLVAMYRRLNEVQSGGVVVGTSEPPLEDDLAPAAPTGVTVDSISYKQGIDTYATLIVGWAEVTSNSDGTAATDVAGYRVEWRHEADPVGQWQLGADVTTTSAQFGGVGSGVDVRVRVAAYDRDGNVSAWSAEVVHLTETDLTPPPVPSTPVVSNYLGVLLCEWDGLGSAGEAMPVDFSHVEVHMSTAAGFVPDATTYVDRLFAAGRWPVADLPYGVEHFFRLVAVDRTLPAPNSSAASGVGSATPGQVVSADVFDGAIGSAKLADLAVTTAKINDLAVNDAKIGDLSVGKLTAGTFSAEMTLSGIIRTALSGARVEIDNAGVRLYNSGGTATIDLNAATGSALVSGEYRSAQSGTRFIINSGGINPDEMRFYPSSGSQYGTINTVTSNSVDFGVQTGLSIKAHSGHAHGFSGQVQAFPDYASMSWGETSIQTVPQQIGIGAPRLHFAAFSNSDFAVGDDEIMRFGIVDRNDPPDFITASVIEYVRNGSGEPYWRSFHNNSGTLFAPNNVGSVNAASSGYIQHRASSFDTFTSSRDSKTAFAELDFTGGALGACRRAKPQKFKRKDEIARDGVAAPVHIGPMADDLPPEVVRHAPEMGMTGLSLNSLVGLVHGGLNELADAVDALTARVAALETRTPRGGP